MNDRQLLAIEYPCARADDTLDRRFHRMLTEQGRWVSTIVTVNK